jgi:ABC-type lipoprotein release transport system permease subunit
MIAGVGLTSLLGLKLGDQVGFPSRRPDASPLRLVGTFSSSVDLYTSDVVLCDEADARAILGLEEGQATDLAVWVTNPSESHVIATKITAKLPGSRVIEKQLLGRIYALTFGRRAGLVLAATVPALIALLVLAWDRASGLGPDEKREIGVLKAVGWSTTDVLNAKLLEAFLVSAMAASIGLALGYLWVFVLDAPGLRATLSGWSTLYPTVHLTPAVDLAELLALALAIVAPFVGLSIVPAWRAATMDPMEAMRG